jgi:hypothetical protein
MKEVYKSSGLAHEDHIDHTTQITMYNEMRTSQAREMKGHFAAAAATSDGPR